MKKLLLILLVVCSISVFSQEVTFRKILAVNYLMVDKENPNGEWVGWFPVDWVYRAEESSKGDVITIFGSKIVSYIVQPTTEPLFKIENMTHLITKAINEKNELVQFVYSFPSDSNTLYVTIGNEGESKVMYIIEMPQK
jgi:hypothetical protein